MRVDTYYNSVIAYQIFTRKHLYGALYVIGGAIQPENLNLARRTFMQTAGLTCAYSMVPGFASVLAMVPPTSDPQHITIDCARADGPLTHYWEECVGSDRAIVGLRQQWQTDLEQVKREAGFRSVRFHGLFNDEMGVWPGASPAPNFLYVDMVFDAMLERGVKPLVELSFMPGGLASAKKTVFFYQGNITPPTEMAQWAELIGALATHCIERYGAEEVVTWNFEVWNEPNLKFFWSGTKDEYFELYRQAATALKKVDARLRVGGPATAETQWVGDLLEFCSAKQVPIDFVSTHIYPDDPQDKVFGPGVSVPFEEVIPRAVTKVKNEVKASKFPNVPVYITEWSSQNPAFIAHTVRSCIGLADMMSFWTFDNIFEELGVPKRFMNSSFGLLGMRGVPRRSYHTFTLLHKLGDVRLHCDDASVLATRRKDGSMAILAWNLIPQPPGRKHSSMGDPMLQTAVEESDDGESKQIILKFEGERKHLKGHVTRVDRSSGDFRSAYREMGSPPYPTMRQIAELKRRSELAKAEPIALSSEKEIRLTIPANGIALLELS